MNTTFQGGDAKLVHKEEDQVDRMSTDQILQNPLWAAIYRRGWADRSVDIQRSQDETTNLDPTTCSSEHYEQYEPSPAVKVRTDAQRARIRKNYQKLKEKIKAKRQLANEQ
uniref:Uncharacterized protein n=1 Tax=Schizaphis graminum TaxID=13262 RepID=A0A2S2NK11_SCHGA